LASPASAQTRSIQLSTKRLSLRPSQASDAVRAFEIQSNWNVTRNLRMTRFPPVLENLTSWFASHETEWRAGTAYRFAILRDHRMIGLVDVDEIADAEGSLGYWLDEAAWSQGLAFEAASAVVDFAFEQMGLRVLHSGHASDNIASGRVLTKLGFAPIGDVTISSLARGGDFLQRRYRLMR
jgi:RimJ/RimL family protein N-acetyltransferase